MPTLPSFDALLWLIAASKGRVGMVSTVLSMGYWHLTASKGRALMAAGTASTRQNNPPDRSVTIDAGSLQTQHLGATTEDYVLVSYVRSRIPHLATV